MSQPHPSSRWKRTVGPQWSSVRPTASSTTLHPMQQGMHSSYLNAISRPDLNPIEYQQFQQPPTILSTYPDVHHPSSVSPSVTASPSLSSNASSSSSGKALPVASFPSGSWDPSDLSDQERAMQQAQENQRQQQLYLQQLELMQRLQAMPGSTARPWYPTFGPTLTTESCSDSTILLDNPNQFTLINNAKLNRQAVGPHWRSIQTTATFSPTPSPPSSSPQMHSATLQPSLASASALAQSSSTWSSPSSSPSYASPCSSSSSTTAVSPIMNTTASLNSSHSTLTLTSTSTTTALHAYLSSAAMLNQYQYTSPASIDQARATSFHRLDHDKDCEMESVDQQESSLPSPPHPAFSTYSLPDSQRQKRPSSGHLSFQTDSDSGPSRRTSSDAFGDDDYHVQEEVNQSSHELGQGITEMRIAASAPTPMRAVTATATASEGFANSMSINTTLIATSSSLSSMASRLHNRYSGGDDSSVPSAIIPSSMSTSTSLHPRFTRSQHQLPKRARPKLDSTLTQRMTSIAETRRIQTGEQMRDILQECFYNASSSSR